MDSRQIHEEENLETVIGGARKKDAQLVTVTLYEFEDKNLGFRELWLKLTDTGGDVKVKCYEAWKPIWGDKLQPEKTVLKMSDGTVIEDTSPLGRYYSERISDTLNLFRITPPKLM